MGFRDTLPGAQPDHKPEGELTPEQQEVLEKVDDYLDKNGLHTLDPFHRSENHPGSFARPRKFEIASAINRLRSVRFSPLAKE